MKNKLILIAVLSTLSLSAVTQSAYAELRRKTDPAATQAAPLNKAAPTAQPAAAPAPAQPAVTQPAVAQPVKVAPTHGHDIQDAIDADKGVSKAQHAREVNAFKVNQAREARILKNNETKALASLNRMKGCNEPEHYRQIEQYGFSQQNTTPAIQAKIKHNCDAFNAATDARIKALNDQIKAMDAKPAQAQHTKPQTQVKPQTQAQAPAQEPSTASSAADGVGDFFGKLGNSMQKGKTVKECSGAETAMHSNGC